METVGDRTFQTPRLSPRDSFNRWFVTHEVAWELAMAEIGRAHV